MRALLQRVADASVTVDGEEVSRIGVGLLILLGVMSGDEEEDLGYLVEKCAKLRIFPDEEGRMNRSVQDVGGEALVVSQFTLAANTRKGRRPSFVAAADPEIARATVDRFCEGLRGLGIETSTGVFAADMKVRLLNDGPVTIWIDSRARGD